MRPGAGGLGREDEVEMDWTRRGSLRGSKRTPRGVPGTLRLAALMSALGLGAAVAGSLVSPASALDAAVEPYDPPQTCPLCSGDLAVPVVPLTPARLDSLAGARARGNAAQIGRIDSLFKAGYYGSPKTHEARRAAHLVARLTLVNGYPDLVRLASDKTRVYEADEAALQTVNERYSDVLLFAAARLKRVRLGLGRACLQYDVETNGEGQSAHGGKRLRWRVTEATVGGKTRRLLSLDLPTATDDVVEVLLAPHYTFRVEYEHIEGPPAYDFYLVHDIQGGWLRRSGTHRPSAFMYWVTPLAPIAAEMARTASVAGGTNGKHTVPAVDLPETPLVGVRIYIPGLRLRLPAFLPDINFDDLREIEPPMPILEMEYLKKRNQPAWLGSSDHLGFKDWKGYGSLPPAIRSRFPDQ